MPKLEKFGFLPLQSYVRRNCVAPKVSPFWAGCYRYLPDAGEYPERLSSKQIPPSRPSTDLR